jgi:hypothetical protein
MNLKGTLRQKVIVRRRGGTDRFGEPAWGAPEELPARKELRQNRLRSQQGTEILTSTEVMMIEELAVDDEIDGETIQDRENIVLNNGKVAGWIYYL